jgi:hypothetical protein
MTTRYIPEVFFIESLQPEDEGYGRFEGSYLSGILGLHGKHPVYRYVRTRHDFEEAVAEFGNSQCRYLHISAHGEAEGMSTTNNEEIDFDELAGLLKPHLRDRRLFLSACSMVRKQLAEEIMPNSGCYSLVGPTEDIHFTDSAVVWSSMYHLLFRENPERVTRKPMQDILQKVCALFSVKLAFFTNDSKSKRGYSEVYIE